MTNNIQNLGMVLEAILPQASKVYIAIAMINDYGLKLLHKVQNSAEIKLITGIDLPTPPDALKQLVEANQIDLRVYSKPGSTFHPKVYLLEIEKEWSAYVGSANFTKGGMQNNQEMTIGVGDAEMITELKAWFEALFQESQSIDQAWVNDYEAKWNEINSLNQQKRALLNQFKSEQQAISSNDPLKKYDFTNQFFKYEHHHAFCGDKPWNRNDEGVIKERMQVKKRFYKLHDLLWPEIRRKKWNVEPHYEFDHIVSSHEHSIGTSDALHALWLSYNKPKKEIKFFDQSSTPLLQMRLQVLIRHTNVAFHLTVGKDGGGILERKEIANRLRSDSETFLEQFNELLKGLPQDYYINVGDDERNVHHFNNDSLYDYLKRDDIENHYFLIGTKFSPDYEGLDKNRIVTTTIQEFTRLFPLYQFLSIPYIG